VSVIALEYKTDIADTLSDPCHFPRLTTGFVISRGTDVPRYVGLQGVQIPRRFTEGVQKLVVGNGAFADDLDRY
jgi:hypothetical protein